MIFSELYGAYYNAVAQLVQYALAGELTDERMFSVIGEQAFGESAIAIPRALKGEEWQLITADKRTPLRHAPTLPLTHLQKRWLKAISLDKRMRLFDADFSWLDGVEPLFKPEDIVVFDKYEDGDPYDESGYVFRFRVILSAVREKQALKISIINRLGKEELLHVVPRKLEYSEKDDKFRLYTDGCRYGQIINLVKIRSVRPYFGERFYGGGAAPREERVVFELTDERNSLERCLLHFAHFKKEVERIAENKYRIDVFYEKYDETELVIRILSFGPFVKVLSSERFVYLIRQRLKGQKNYRL